MPEKFQNKYRTSSTRLQTWDYGKNAPYFVTICTQNRECFFGKVIDGEMQLSEIGEIARKYWLEIPNHFPFVVLDAFVVMPNHVHGIVVINKPIKNGATIVETPNLGVSTRDTNAPNHYHQTANARKKWKSASLGAIINQYKRICTIHARKTIPNFAWQSLYHDHIIRNDDSFQRIRKYINENPLKWKEDKFYD
ncbi:MAG: hypothetical protein HC831_21465 [Chloroflexia bacterium]|nr:hypothetical protein [Chloroflexia bacterium]